MCCSQKESDTNKQLNNNPILGLIKMLGFYFDTLPLSHYGLNRLAKSKRFNLFLLFSFLNMSIKMSCSAGLSLTTVILYYLPTRIF